jgi:hypothetical protein
MRERSGKVGWLVLAALVLGAGIVMLALHRNPLQPESPPHTTTIAGTPPASAPATHPVQASLAPRDLLGIVRANDPAYPTIRELEVPASYDQAAHLIIPQPSYLCPIGHLWITDHRGRTLTDTLRDLGNGNSHVVTDLVAFVHWQLTDSGKWIASAIRKNPDGGFELVQTSHSTPLPTNRHWLWDRAVAWDDKIVVPTDRGVSVFTVGDPARESFQSLADDAPNLSTPVVLFDAGGIVAWMPWESGKTGSHGAARFADGKWTRLGASQGWPDKILQLIPLRDGSILQLIPNNDGSVDLKMSGIARDTAKVDEKEVQRLVEQLSDPDQANRDAAYEQLTRFGPGIFPLLQRLQENQPPAAQGRIDELLRAKVKLTLGPITLQPGKVSTAARLRDGGVVLYCDGGVSVARGSAERSNLIAPAWLSIRPGYAVQVLPSRMTQDLTPGKQQIFAFKSEWIVGSESQGLRWFVGNYFSPLQNKDEYRFRDFIGIDSHGRWIMATPDKSEMLIVDPNLPDPTPRLPVWLYTERDGPIGWTNTNWPAVKPNGIVVLDATAWRDPTPDEKFYEHEADMPTIAPTTAATTGPATTQEATDLILADKDGTRYYDGSSTIRVKTPDGKEVTWPLPPAACGTGDVWFFHCGEDRFFLFNQPGRVLRLRRTADRIEPFKLEATFTHNIPNVDGNQTWIDRIWLDPAGRLVMACSGHTLAILFPTGQVPPEIKQMMPPERPE